MTGQMSERESLAQHLRAADEDYQAREQSANAGRAKDEPGDWWEFMSDAALAWFAEHLRPRVVSMVEWGVRLDDIGSTDLYESEDAARAALADGGVLVKITTTTESEDR